MAKVEIILDCQVKLKMAGEMNHYLKRGKLILIQSKDWDKDWDG